MKNQTRYFSMGMGLVLFIGSLVPIQLPAQALEEIIVTAQRREQSIQDVPLSIETFSGDTINSEGFRNMEDLAFFSPSVYIQDGIQEQRIAVRGFGTIGNSLTLEQAVPIFVDNIHYGRQSQIKTAFLDVERVEVLKGPQPVFFGQNASAGAFNIQSKRPTPEWEVDVNSEYGSNGSYELSLGAGGPISDTWGIRVAGIREESDGYLKHIISGKKYPAYDNLGGRVTLQWTPNDALEARLKFEGSRLRNGSEAMIGCRIEGNPIFGRKGAGSGAMTDTKNRIGPEESIYIEPPRGSGYDGFMKHKMSPECFKGNIGFSSEGPYEQPQDHIRQENGELGFFDIREAANIWSSGGGQGSDDGIGGTMMNGIEGEDRINTWNVVLNLEYAFDNGVMLNSTSGHNAYLRNNKKDNSNSPFLANFQGRQEEFDQWSTELRFTSPSGGSIEWMAGASYQITSKDNYSSSLRATSRRGQRFNWLWEDASWTNVFAVVTLNFLDDRASLDIGGRWSEVWKDVQVYGYGSQWVFDTPPCRPKFLSSDDRAGVTEITKTELEACAASVDTADADTMHSSAVKTTAADARILVEGADLNNLYYLTYDQGSDKRRSPPNWFPSMARAVGLAPLNYAYRLGKETDAGAPVTDEFTDPSIDPQITFRYRPNDDHSLFFRWAMASKAAGFDTGQTTLPANLDELKFEAEKAETYEIGSKGIFLDGAGRYDFTIFRTDFTDLQLSGLAPISNQDSTSVATNAGLQRVDGIELGVVAALTESFTLGLSGAIMDARMMEFEGSGCNFSEVWNTKNNLGLDVNVCDNDNGEITDRTGQQAPRTPDWKFVMDTKYSLPVSDNHRAFVNTKAYYSDGLITARDSFSRTVMYNKHYDANISLGVANIDDSWTLAFFANNVFEARQSYNAEYDAIPDGMASVRVSPGNFMTYGVRFNYKFR